MSEADTPNNAFSGDQGNPSSSPKERSDPGTLPVSEEVNRQSLDFQAFSSWVEAAETRTVAALPMAETRTPSASPTAEAETVSAAPSELTEMAALTQELHSTNSNLLKRITQLEQKLAESQKVLQQHKKRSQAQEAMFTEKQHELTEAQEQTRRLFYELDAAHQTTQRQQILIETLTDQLEISQEQVAQLERECASTQAIYNQQSYHLLETENTCRELRSRLSRQQRHTLQFKVALEKCLEVPIPGQHQADTIPLEVATPAFDRTEAPSLVSKAQPIPPWSAQTETLNEESAWDMSPTSTNDTWTDQSTAPVEVVEVATDVPTAVTLTYPIFGQQFSQAVSTPKGTFEEQLDALLNLLFEPSSTTLTSPPETTPTLHINENTSGAREAHWQDAASSLPEGTISTPDTSPDNLPDNLPDNSPDISFDSAIASSPSSTPFDPAGSVLNHPYQRNDDRDDLYANALEEADSGGLLSLFDHQRPRLLPIADIGSNQGSNITQTSLPDPSSNNSPAPVVYPLRPPKGRKSLAAVELPTFPLLQT